MFKLKLLTILLLTTLFGHCASAINIISDEETESALKQITHPILKEAGLNPGSVNIYIVKDKTLNAFVMGGQNLFIHSGLITYSTDPSFIAGVIAHEIGHMAGGHLVSLRQSYSDATAQMMVTALAGIAAGVATQSTDVAMAGIMGGQSMAERSLYRFSREHEVAADSASISYMKKLNIPTTGIEKFHNDMATSSRTMYGKVDQYMQTHPMSTDRLDYIRKNRVTDTGTSYVAKLAGNYKRVVAKLRAYLDDNETSDLDGVNLAYYKAIRDFRVQKLDAAYSAASSLATTEASNPFFHELKADIAYQKGNISEAIQGYQKAYNLVPKSKNFKIEYAMALIASKQNPQTAIKLLNEIVDIAMDDYPIAWQQLAIAYDLAGDKKSSAIANGWYNYLNNDAQTAQKMVNLVESLGIEEMDKKFLLRYRDLKSALNEA